MIMWKSAREDGIHACGLYGTTYYHAVGRMDFTGEEQSQSSRTVWLPGMRLELLRNTPGMKHQLELIADYSQKMPSMFQLMGLRFDSDPLN